MEEVHEVDRRAGSRRRTGELSVWLLQGHPPVPVTDNEPPKCTRRDKTAQQSNSWVAQPLARAPLMAQV